MMRVLPQGPYEDPPVSNMGGIIIAAFNTLLEIVSLIMIVVRAVMLFSGMIPIVPMDYIFLGIGFLATATKLLVTIAMLIWAIGITVTPLTGKVLKYLMSANLGINLFAVIFYVVAIVMIGLQDQTLTLWVLLFLGGSFFVELALTVAWWMFVDPKSTSIAYIQEETDMKYLPVFQMQP